MRLSLVAFCFVVVGAVACSGSPLGATMDDDAADAQSDVRIPSDASASGPGSEADASGPHPADAGDASAALTPGLRLVNLYRRFAPPIRINVCGQRHGAPVSVAPLFSASRAFGEVAAHVPVTAGTYDFRVLFSGDGLPGAGDDCTSDGGVTADGLTGVVVSGPTTLTVFGTSELGMFAFSDAATPTAGMANVRARNAFGSAISFYAVADSAEVALGTSVSSGTEAPMRALVPDAWRFQFVAGGGSVSASPSPTTTAGTWDVFAYRASSQPGHVGLAVCPESSGVRSCITAH